MTGKPTTQRHVIGRYRIDEPRPGHWRVYQGQADHAIHRIGEFPTETAALKHVADRQYRDIQTMANDINRILGAKDGTQA